MNDLQPQSIGWYGKLPSRGDFVGRGLPRPWLRAWDDWLQRSLAAAARELGAAALRERMLAMPAWQCVVFAGPPGEPAWAGVVTASCDRVGRVFPLLLAEAYDEAALDRAGLGSLRARARALAGWLRDAGAHAASPKEFEAGAAHLHALPWDANGASDEDDDSLAGLRISWPDAVSFWWRAEPGGDAVEAPRAEGWPPREGLMLELLA